MLAVSVPLALGIAFTDGSLEGLPEMTGRTSEEEQSELLYMAISQLNKIDRAIIMLWLEEHSYDEIADIMGISRSNVSVKLVRIKKSLSETVKRLEK